MLLLELSFLCLCMDTNAFLRGCLLGFTFYDSFGELENLTNKQFFFKVQVTLKDCEGLEYSHAIDAIYSLAFAID